jgi:hypothetical protein
MQKLNRNEGATTNGIWAGRPSDTEQAVKGIARSALANGTAVAVDKPANWDRYPGYDISNPHSSLRETAKVIKGEVYVEQSHWSKQYFHCGRYIP